MKKKKITNKLLRNKKGALLDGIGNLIQGIIDIVPPQVKFLFFLLLIVLFSYVLTIIFNAFGVYCNTANEPVKINANLFQSVSLIGQTPELTEINQQAVEGNVKSCRVQLGRGDGFIYYPSTNTSQEITSDSWYYKGTYCSQCTLGIVKNMVNETREEVSSGGEVCVGTATPTPTDDKTWWQRVVCNDDNQFFGSCEPPEGYQFDPSIGLYVCASQSCESRTIADEWDGKLRERGANLLYDNYGGERDISEKGFLGITCTDLAPRLAIFGLDIFTFTIWIFLTLIILLFWAWKHFT